MKLVEVPGPADAPLPFHVLVMPDNTVAIPHRRTCEVWGLSWENHHLAPGASLYNKEMGVFLKSEGFLKPHVRMPLRVYKLHDFCSLFEDSSPAVVKHILSNIRAVVDFDDVEPVRAKKRDHEPLADIDKDIDAMMALVGADAKIKIHARKSAWKRAHIEQHEAEWQREHADAHAAEWKAAWIEQNKGGVKAEFIANHVLEWRVSYVDAHAAEWKARGEAAMMQFIQGRVAGAANAAPE